MMMKRLYQILSVVVLGALSLGCGSDSTGPSGVDHEYWKLALDHHAVTLATQSPYDTLQLSATPLAFDGTPVSTSAQPVYTVSDSSVVTVSPTGLLTAQQTGSSVTVVAKLKIGNLTLADTAIVNVNNVAVPPPVLTTFSIQPAPGDSAQVSPTFTNFITPTILDQHNNPIGNVVVHFWSADSTVVSIDQTGTTTGVVPGKAMVYAEATVYGVHMVDSVEYTVAQPLIATEIIAARTPKNSTTPVSYFSPSELTIGTGGYVLWLNNSGQPVDIVFDTPAAADSAGGFYALIFQFFYGLGTPDNPNTAGNIPAFPATDSTSGADGVGVRIRQFLTPGRYPYHSTLYNTTGTIIVSGD